MNFVVILFALFLVSICLILSVNHPYEFLIIWGLTASRYDANGVVNYLESYLGIYGLLMNGILVVALVISIWRSSKLRNERIKKYYHTSIILIIWIVFCFSLVSIGAGIRLHNMIYPLIDFSPIIMLIWILNRDYYLQKGKTPEDYILFYICVQVLLAFLIVYLPEYGINIFDQLSGANYIADGLSYNKNLFHLRDILVALGNKYFFNGLGQFHNGNDMGFYGIAGIVSAVVIASKRKLTNKIFAVFLFICSVTLWGNSGMRGPVVGVAIGLIVYFFVLKKRTKIAMIFGGTAIILLMLSSKIGEEVISYFLPETGDISYASRSVLRVNGLRYIAQHPLIGAGGTLGLLTAMQIDPHELPLRMACLFGIPGAILIFYLVYVLPAMDFLRSRNKELVAILAYSIVVMVSMTNNYTDICLFWLLYAEAICTFVQGKPIFLEKSGLK